MHFAISSTWGATDPTRASLPFIFAASALQSGDSVMIMLFHDAVTISVRGAHAKLVPVGPPPRFAEVFSHANAEILVCKPCAEARGIREDMLAAPCRFGGMNDFHAHASRDSTRIVCF
jgi:tRNA 2-thiouridine synthesizing protein D